MNSAKLSKKPINKKRPETRASYSKGADFESNSKTNLSGKRFTKKLNKIRTKERHYSVKKITKILVVLSLIAGAVYSIYRGSVFFIDKMSNEVIISPSEIDRRIKAILPTDETPISIGRIMDGDVLASQSSFYTGSKEGDYIVRYPTKMVIYRLIDNKIVNVLTSPVTVPN